MFSFHGFVFVDVAGVIGWDEEKKNSCLSWRFWLQNAEDFSDNKPFIVKYVKLHISKRYFNSKTEKTRINNIK